MKKTVAALAIGSAIAISGCATEKIVYVDSTTVPPAETAAAPETTEAPATTQAPPPETRPTLPPEPEEPPMNGYQPDVYLDYTRDNTPYWYYSYTDENLKGLAIALCDELDAGMAIDRLLIDTMVMADDIDPVLNDDIGLFFRGVVRYICPEHYGQIEALDA